MCFWFYYCVCGHQPHCCVDSKKGSMYFWKKSISSRSSRDFILISQNSICNSLFSVSTETEYYEWLSELAYRFWNGYTQRHSFFQVHTWSKRGVDGIIDFFSPNWIMIIVSIISCMHEVGLTVDACKLRTHHPYFLDVCSTSTNCLLVHSWTIWSLSA